VDWLLVVARREGRGAGEDTVEAGGSRECGYAAEEREGDQTAICLRLIWAFLNGNVNVLGASVGLSTGEVRWLIHGVGEWMSEQVSG